MEPHQRRMPAREDVLLVTSAVVLGLVAAAVFAAYRAVSSVDDALDSRLAEFASSMLWPGLLIFSGVAAAVFFGWKANLD